MADAQRGAKAKLSAADWERAALDLIAEKGVQALAVESLARRMGITKGSFYWHFPNREALLEQALLRWELHDNRNVKAVLQGSEGVHGRLRQFVRGVARESLTHDVYSALCAAADHPQVAPVLQRVAEQRMQQLTVAFAELGLGAAAARQRARLAYSAYVGFLQLQRQQLVPSFDSDEFETYMDHVVETLITQ